MSLPSTRISSWRMQVRPLVLPGLAVLAIGLAACSDKAPTPVAAPAAVPAVPAPAPVAATPAAPVAAAAVPAAAAAPRQVPLQVQGTAGPGLSVRVKSVDMGDDATRVAVSASYSSRISSYTKLASMDTFLEDEAGNRFMLKRPADNPDLKIVSGDTMEGTLVFLGAIAPGTKQVTLVFNQGMLPDNSIGPGLTMKLPLVAGGSGS